MNAIAAVGYVALYFSGPLLFVAYFQPSVWLPAGLVTAAALLCAATVLLLGKKPLGPFKTGFVMATILRLLFFGVLMVPLGLFAAAVAGGMALVEGVSLLPALGRSLSFAACALACGLSFARPARADGA